MHCVKCNRQKESCNCDCKCCGEPLIGCPALCSHICDHCLISTDTCDYGRVLFTLDLDAAKWIPGSEKRFRDDLVDEVCCALQIPRMQVKMGALKYGSITSAVRFASCQDIARKQNCLGTCVVSKFDQTTGCLCPSRCELVVQFLLQCEHPNSPLRLGKLFAALRPKSAFVIPFEQAPTCIKCSKLRDKCKCICENCRRPLDACWYKCRAPVNLALPAASETVDFISPSLLLSPSTM